MSDPVLIFAIAMAAFLLMPLLTNRLRLPDIIGVLVAGIIVGPHGFGLLELNEGGAIWLLGKVGLLYLVFLAGLEVDLADLTRKRDRAVSFGVLTFIVPMILGTLGGWLFFDYNISTAILLGSVFSSHSFLALLIAKRLGLTEREMTVAVIGGTVITDTLALFVLAVVAQSETNDNFSFLFLLRLLVQTIIFSGVVVFAIPLLGRWFFRRVNDGGSQFAFMMVVLFACGYVAHVVGLEPIIGAFLAGLAMNRLVPHQGVLANRAFFFGNTILVPFFLLSVGMLIDLKMVVSDLRTIEMAIFMTLTVIVSKGGAAWLMRLLFGYGKADAVVAWGLSLPQAATTLAVVLVGHELKLFDDAVLNATIVMVFVTCMLGPILVQAAGRKIATQEANEAGDDDLEPSEFQRILIPLANPQSSNNLLDLAITLRRPMNDEPLLPTSVASREAQVANSERLLGASIVHMAGAEVPVTPVIRVDPTPINGILRAYTESRATSMVVGWAGPEAHWQRHFHLNRGVIDDLISETTGQLWVVRLTEPMSVIEDVVMVLPELAYTEPGFYELMADTKLLAKRSGGKLTIVCLRSLSEAVKNRIISLNSKCTTDFITVDGDLYTRVDELVNVKTLLCVFGSREGTLSWDSAWTRQLTGLAHRYREISFIACYSRVDVQPLTQSIVKQVDQRAILRRARITFDHDQVQDIGVLIKKHLSKKIKISNKLLSHLEEGMSALNSKVALVHATTGKVSRAQLHIIILPQGHDYQDLSIQVILVLLNPVGTAAHHHLGRLAAIARAFSSLEDVEQMIEQGAEDQDLSEQAANRVRDILLAK